MPPISVLIKPASGSCNMHCDYCFYRDEAENRSIPSYGIMSEDTLKNVIRRTLPRAEGSVSYAFQGGEPTLRGLPFFEKAIRYQQQYNHKGITVRNVIQTNGVLLDDDWCAFLHRNRFLVGLSVDGTRCTHEKYRHLNSGGSSFDAVLRAVGLLEKHGVEFNILTVVNSDVADNIEEIWEFYEKQGWVWQQYIPCLEPLLEGPGNRSYSLSPEKYGDFLIRLFDLWKSSLMTPHPVSVRTFDNWVGILMGYPPEACDQCGKCSVQYVVEADGSVFPCDFYVLDRWCLGNFNSDRIDAIDSGREETGFLASSDRLHAKCGNCPHRDLCRGGCRRYRGMSGAEPGLNYLCPAFLTFFDAKKDEMKALADELQKRKKA